MNQKVSLLNLIVFTLLGCGGSQQGSSSQGYLDNSKKPRSTNEGSSAYIQPIFLTELDSSSKKHFWVKVHRVELESVQQKFPAFTSKEGIWFDFGSHSTGLTHKSLYLGDSRADFLPEVVRATLTLGPKFLEQESQGTVQKHLFALGKGQKEYKVSTLLNSEDRKKNNQPLAIDFNLRSLIINSDGKYSLEPKISFNTDNFTVEKQVPSLFQGEANDVIGSGASLGFLLREENKGLKVIADSQTKSFSHLGTVKDAQIKNRTDLEVWGEYQPSKKAFVAQWIRLLLNHNDQNKIATITGKIVSVNNVDRSFQVAPFRIKGFIPQKMVVNVYLDKESIMIDSDGKLVNEKSLRNNNWVHIEGSWNKNQTFHGQWVKLTSTDK